ncbi:hypothetical protein SAMN05216285_0331 [Natrinema salifodinae]|uniref:Uncharacterized protein n=1 Tax=Natrinema salifodinae TaxID=1202768 RepID=A0A1I0M1Q5_9EURY|nr:hypothetical protein SAMN05216285_0331 [Natrinema salifodinae]
MTVRRRFDSIAAARRAVRRGPSLSALRDFTAEAAVSRPYRPLGGCYWRSTEHTRTPVCCSFGVLFRSALRFQTDRSVNRGNRQFVVAVEPPFFRSPAREQPSCGRPSALQYRQATALSSPSIVMGAGGLNSAHGCVPSAVSNSPRGTAVRADAALVSRREAPHRRVGSGNRYRVRATPIRTARRAVISRCVESSAVSATATPWNRC